MQDDGSFEEGSLHLLTLSHTYQLWVRTHPLQGVAYISRLSRTLMHAAASFAGYALWLVPVHDDVREGELRSNLLQRHGRDAGD